MRKGRGFELDPTIFRLTLSNSALLDHPIELIQGNYRELLDRYKFPKDHYLVVFLAPPWTDALDSVSGLDFARTRPPIAEIVADVERVYPSNGSRRMSNWCRNRWTRCGDALYQVSLIRTCGPNLAFRWT